MNVNEVIFLLKQKSNAAYLAGMKRFAIVSDHALGIPVPELRKIAKVIKKDHSLARQLWETKIHEARILASMIDDPILVTEQQADAWVKDFNSWDICDQVCGNLLNRTPFAFNKAKEYTGNEIEFIKRAGFVLMAELAVYHKAAENVTFLTFLPFTERHADDDRNFVKKAVSWALRQIGKRNSELQKMAINTANRILLQNSKSAKWIATDVLKELNK